ncbi:MAG TPA: DHA2 family efflux MFS transporter permease subunit [Acidimicrobiales bacterium]|nr:DHA2 family efflux MFS transporter permease subunit [Acidimicrobiales bacterium]
MPGGQSHQDTHGIPPQVYHRRWLILAILNLSLVTIVIAVSALNVALPTIQRDLGASGTELQWIVDAYALVFAGLLLPAGALGDRFGRKGALETGLVIFGLAALAASQANDPGQLIAMRTVMGVGAALIMPATLSIILNSFPIQERPKAIAIWAAFAGVGGALGPITSGLLLEHFWWGSVFMVSLPVVGSLLVLTMIFVPTSRDPSHTALDPIGSLLAVVALVGLVFSVIEGPELGWTSPATIAGFVAFVVAGFAWARYELTIENPILDPRLFRVRSFSTGAAAITTIFLCTFGLFFLITQFFQFVQGYTPLEAGFRQLPYAITLVIVAPRGPRIIARFGVRPSVRVGCWLGALGFALLATIHVDTPYWLIALGIIPIGMGAAVLMPAASQLIVGSVPLAKSGVGSAVNDVTREVGAALGIAALGSIMATRFHSAMEGPASTLPPDLQGAAKESVGQALAVAQHVGGDAGVDLARSAQHAFTQGVSLAFIVAAGIMAVAGYAFGRLMPNALPSRIIPSVAESTATLELDAP